MESTNNKDTLYPIISNEYYTIKKMKPPKLDENIINSCNKILNKIKMSTRHKKKLIVGVIKFRDNENIEYIHCPLLTCNDNNDICIGVCNHFDSVVNDLNGKKHLASHKYQFHYKCKSMEKNKNKVQIFIKTSESI